MLSVCDLWTWRYCCGSEALDHRRRTAYTLRYLRLPVGDAPGNRFDGLTGAVSGSIFCLALSRSGALGAILGVDVTTYRRWGERQDCNVCDAKSDACSTFCSTECCVSIAYCTVLWASGFVSGVRNLWCAPGIVPIQVLLALLFPRILRSH